MCFKSTVRFLKRAFEVSEGTQQMKIRTRADDIKKLKNDIRSCRETLAGYKKSFGQDRYRQMVRDAKQKYTPSSIFLTKETVDQFFKRMRCEHPTQFDANTDKGALLKVFENMHSKRMQVLRQEKSHIDTMLQNEMGAKVVEEEYLPNQIENHAKYSSQDDLYEAVCDLKSTIDRDCASLKRKEELLNRFKKFRIILNAFEQVSQLVQRS